MGRSTCLTLTQRVLIEKGIASNNTKREIAVQIGVSESAVGKEIKLHRFQSYHCHLGRECNNYKTCIHNRICSPTCPDFVKFVCKRRDRSPGACNGCSNFTYCRFTKYKYSSTIAHNAYKKLLIESRSGINKTEEELKIISDIVCPLILKGQSPYMIVSRHPELGISEKTLYTYIINGFFKVNNVSVMDLRRYVSRKVPKKIALNYKKRKDKKILEGRKWEDFQQLLETGFNPKILQMDTVYNDKEHGPYLLTLKFLEFDFMFIVFLESKTDNAVVEGFTFFCNIIGDDLYKKYINIVTPDRGSEFSSPDKIEKALDGSSRCKVFYCDPMASWQKGSLENNHEFIRYFTPKESDMRKLGLDSQHKVDLMTANINSFPKEKLNGKSSFELMEFLAPDLYKKFKDYGISQIPTDDVVLNASIFKK